MTRLKILSLIALLLLPLGLRAADADSTKFKISTPLVSRVGASVAINAALTEVLKSSIDATRPNGIDNDSWPSRHTSYAFTAASIVAHELHAHSAWWVVGAHAVADAVALQRLYANEHYPKDVIGGALVGLVSTEVGYLLSNLIFPDSRPALPQVLSDWLPTFDITTLAAFPLSGGVAGYDSKMAMFASARASIPFSDQLGLTAALNLRSMPLCVDKVYADMLNTFGLSRGLAGYIELPKRWAAEFRVLPGITRNLACSEICKAGWGLTVDASALASYRLTEFVAIGFETGYSFWGMKNDVSTINLGFFSRIML